MTSEFCLEYVNNLEILFLYIKIHFLYYFEEKYSKLFCIKIHLISFGTCKSLIIHIANALLELQWLESNILGKVCTEL